MLGQLGEDPVRGEDADAEATGDDYRAVEEVALQQRVWDARRQMTKLLEKASMWYRVKGICTTNETMQSLMQIRTRGGVIHAMPSNVVRSVCST